MNARDFSEVWLQSAIAERHEAKMNRRYAAKYQTGRDRYLRKANEAFLRGMFDLDQVRRFRSESNADN